MTWLEVNNWNRRVLSCVICTFLSPFLFVQALESNLPEGSQRLSEASRSGEATLPNTSPSGQTKIRQELKAMNKDFDEFRSQLSTAQEDLEVCLSRWDEFEKSYQQFNNWLKETETYLRAELEQKVGGGEGWKWRGWWVGRGGWGEVGVRVMWWRRVGG
jgi:hypothetical protein